MNDIKFLDEIINLKDKKELLKRKFFWIYPFTNENIKAYYSCIDFNNKNVLCVTSSGDHALNAILAGAKNITSFDINPLAKYYSELKIAAIKSLSLEEFIMFFYKKLTTYKYYLNSDTFLKIRNNLNDNNKEFWDHFFNDFNKKDILKSYLFTDDYLSLKALLEVNSYLQEDNYYILRELLSDRNVTYYDMSLKELNTLNDKFDVVLLSNVSAYSEQIFDTEILKKLKESISKVSKENSRVVVNYYYDNLLFYSNDIIYDTDKISQYFPKEEYEYKSFESAYNIQVRNKFGFSGNNKDLVLIKK